MNGSVKDFAKKIKLSKEEKQFLKDKAEEPKEALPVMDDEKKKNISLTQWTNIENGTFLAVGATSEKLPAGAYTLSICNQGPLFKKQDIKVDELINFKNSIFENILKEVGCFWGLRNEFNKYGFLHRRGYLLYGPPGGGKSCMVQMIMADIIKRDGIVIIAKNPELTTKCLYVFRKVEPKRNIVCIFEDIDAIIMKRGEDELLSFLDGEVQIDRVLNIATTNYPERLDRRIVARPRRFDMLVKIGMPNEVIRREYFVRKLNLKGEELNRWVKASNGFSFAGLADMVISIKCLGKKFDTAIKDLEAIFERKVTSDEWDGMNKIGIKK